MPTAQQIHADAQTVAAWNDYLAACRSAQYEDTPNQWQYEEIEQWAWKRLEQQLRTLELNR